MVKKRPAMGTPQKEAAGGEEKPEPPVNPPEGDQNTQKGEGPEKENEDTPDPDCPFAQFDAGKMPDTPTEEEPPLKKPATAAAAAKAKAKAKTASKAKGVKKDGGNKDKKDKKDKEQKKKDKKDNKKDNKKDKKDKDTPEEEPTGGEPQKKEKKTLKKQTDEWTKALDADKAPDEKNDDEEFDPNEVRDRQKAQKFAKLDRDGALPKEVTDAMEAAGRSANPRAAKTQLINRLFRKEGKGFVMIPKDPAFQKLQRHLDVKFGKEMATSNLAFKKHGWNIDVIF